MRPRHSIIRALGALVLCAYASLTTSAADTWSEIKTPHFTVWSNAGDRAARTMAWQLEQIRSVMATLWPWARVDLAKPMTVFVVKDEQAMRKMAPEYWERKGDVRPASVWVSGADQYYLAIRADVRGEDNSRLNPHTNAYFAYANMVIGSSFARDLPLWFSRGLAGVFSNTIVRDDHVLLGPPIPWHLETLRERRLPVKHLVTMTRSAPEFSQDRGLQRFDAQAWALVHLLMFGERGAYQAGLNRFATALEAGKDPDVAFTEAIGRVEDFELKVAAYVDRNIFSFAKAAVDASVKREQFAVRAMPVAESAGGLAAFHVAMGRPAEARDLVTEARAADAKTPGPYVAEGLQFDREGRRDEARAAYRKAVELGTSSAWAHYRSALLNWGPVSDPNAETLTQMEKDLARAVELHPAFASGYAALAEVRAALRQSPDAIMPILSKALSLEPASPWHRLAGARILWRLGNLEEARKTAQVALAMAHDDAARKEAERLLARIPTKTP